MLSARELDAALDSAAEEQETLSAQLQARCARLEIQLDERTAELVDATRDKEAAEVCLSSFFDSSARTLCICLTAYFYNC